MQNIKYIASYLSFNDNIFIIYNINYWLSEYEMQVSEVVKK